MSNDDRTMTVEEARALLAPYADGLLDQAMAQEVEAVMARVPELQDEFRTIKEENALLAEALAPLRPTQSTRMRVSEVMLDTYKHAEESDKALLDQKSRIIKVVMLVLVLGMCFILGAALLYTGVKNRQPKPKPEPAKTSTETPAGSGQPIRELE